MEIWKDIPGYVGLYKVSNYGRVKSIKCKIRLNRKFQENNFFGTKNKTFCSLSQK